MAEEHTAAPGLALTRWVCPVCEAGSASVEPGERCGRHPDRVLVRPNRAKKAKDDMVLGRVVAGRYAVYDQLGAGGFGAVYRAIQEPIGRPVALKVVHPRHGEDADLRARFFREARLVAKLRHPVVVTLHESGEAPGVGLYMVFELVDGGTLDRLLEEGPQDPIRVTHVCLQLLQALGEAHRLGVVHRDIKPANVMLVREPTGEERVRLLDFGIAKLVGASRTDTVETREGIVVGTPRYLSPEQARGASEIDHRTDLYSLATLAYALLAGKNPFERPSAVQTIIAHMQEPVPMLDPALGVPPALEAVLRRALEKAPEARFASAGEMAEAMRQVFPNVAFPSDRLHIRTADLSGPSAEHPTLEPVVTDEVHSEMLQSPPQRRSAAPWALAAAAIAFFLALGLAVLSSKSVEPEAVPVRLAPAFEPARVPSLLPEPPPERVKTEVERDEPAILEDFDPKPRPPRAGAARVPRAASSKPEPSAAPKPAEQPDPPARPRPVEQREPPVEGRPGNGTTPPRLNVPEF